MKKIILILISIVFISQTIFAQDSNKSASITGKTTSNGGEIPYVSIFLKGTTIGTSTDENAEFNITNLKPGLYTIQIQAIGFKPFEQNIELQNNENKHINIELETDILGLEEVIVTGNRSRIIRKKASNIVNIINSEIFESTQSVTLSEGLNFCSGLRMENDCQNCGFSQVRMNGLEGPYSQILINSRPIFSGLAGVYGLELIPSNMIEKVEIIRGGGSALYGGNAVAGTINILLKDPTQNSFEVGVNNSFIGVGLEDSDATATDYSLNFNATVVGKNQQSGVAFYGFNRNRKPFDANGDSFSEIALLKNTTLGSRMFHKLGTRAKLSLDFFHINEERRGGNKFNYPNHEADISEAVEHNLTTTAVTFEQYYRENDLLSVFAAVQKINRDSYYGAEQSLSDYGTTKDATINAGVQYNAKFKTSDLIVGIEDTYATLKDSKLGYLDIENAVIIGDEIVSIPHTNNTIISNQEMNTLGIFSQYDIKIDKLKLSVGARLDNYSVEDKESNASKKTGNVFSPRVNFLYDIQSDFQARVSYSGGYRAPQIFDEDLHIESSGSRKVIHVNDANLKQETSDSFMASLDYSKSFGTSSFGILVEGFHTKLNNPFTNEYSEPDADGVVTYTRINATDGAFVQGINLELNYVPSTNLKLNAGFTFQKSKYEEAQEFDEKNFFRTPENYGFFTIDWEASDSWCIIGTGTYTGKMLVPYFGTTISNPDEGELRTSETFFDAGLKITKTLKIAHNNLEISGGIKNIFNSYQEDFDTGVDRDPAYIYGPMTPRTIYFGLKFGNILN
ncbi:TonB-dependent receptor [Lutibacter sp. A80]|uniref:TonB-dependent receptor n=1 Tax=Lutibacter sp. A80 TaxID=2918453 RepID=UPI001F06EFAA|nr:TonB-dependent receptor [Lutibacter sp. A80]UMB59861.1 TonB-dependent receptor [Lutibacter sp. A80]